jgi:outer membrane receptor protein involved in Fe transport
VNPHRYERIIVSSFLPCFLLVVPPRTCGADEPVVDTQLEERIEVTATRIPDDVDVVAASVTIVTGDELRARGATDLAGALAFVPGIAIAPGGDGGPASAVPEMLGLREIDAFLLVVDGVPWGGAFNPSVATLDLHDVERIEVMRGAAPVMYGATSFVGVIHVIHAAASSRTREGGAWLGDRGSGGVFLRAPLHLGSRVQSSLAVNASENGLASDRSGFDRRHLLFRAGGEPKAGRWHLDLDGAWVDQEPTSPHPRQGPALSTQVPRDASHQPHGAQLDEARLTLGGGFERIYQHAKWVTTASVSDSSQDVFRGFLADISSIDPNARGFRETIDATDVYFDTHLECTRPKLAAVLGVDHLHGDAVARGGDFDYFVNLDGSGAPAESSIPRDFPVKISDRRAFSGLYGFVDWKPRPRWRIETGLRLNRVAERLERSDEDDPGGAANDSGTTTRLSGSAGVSWTAWEKGADNFVLQTNWRSAFKPAAMDFGIGEEEEGGLLDPETGTGFELGLRSRLRGGSVLLEVTAFHMDLDNLLVAQSVGGLPVLVNGGEIRLRGVDAGVTCRLPHDLTLNASIAFHDAKFGDYVQDFDGVPTQLFGHRFEMSARRLGAFGLSYGKDLGFTGGVEASTTGSRYLNKRNTALAKAFSTVALHAGWRFKRFELAARGENLTDERPAIAESELGDAQYYLLPARTVSLTGTVRF